MSEFRQRTIEVQVGTRIVRGLRVSFKTMHTADDKPDQATIDVYNLSADTRAALSEAERGTPVILKAGYGDDLQRVFSGDSRRIFSKREGTEWVTEITCGDGEVAYITSRIQKTLGKGVSIKGMTKELLDSLGLDATKAKRKVDEATFRKAISNFTSSKSLSGAVMPELKRVLRGFGLQIAIQNDEIILVEIGGAIVPVDQVPVLTPTSGLIGSPEVGNNGIVRIKAILRPEIRPLHKFSVKSQYMDGGFVAKKVQHVGDNYSSTWNTNIEATRL